MQLTHTTGYEIYSKVAEQSTKNFFMLLVGSVVTYWLAGVWRLGAQLLFWAFVVVALFEAAHVVWLYRLGQAADRNARRQRDMLGLPSRERLEESIKWEHRALLVRVASLLPTLFFLFILYKRIW